MRRCKSISFIQQKQVFLQYLPSDPCAGFGICERVMVVDQIVAAGSRHGMQLVVGQLLPEVFARGAAGAVELIIRVIHLVATHHGLEATLIERAIVGY